MDKNERELLFAAKRGEIYPVRDAFDREILSDNGRQRRPISNGVYRYVINDVEKSLIEEALGYACGNQILAAKILGINRNTIRSKIRKLGIHPGRFKR